MSFLGSPVQIFVSLKKNNFAALLITRLSENKAEMLLCSGPLIGWLVIPENHVLGLDVGPSPSGTWWRGHLLYIPSTVDLCSLRALSFVQGELTTCLLDWRGDLTSYLIERPRFVFLFSLTSCVTLNKSHPSDRFQFSHAKMMTRDQVSSWTLTC